MNEEDTKRIEKIEQDIIKLTNLHDTLLTNQERFARSMENILDYMEEHSMKLSAHRPNRLDS